MTDSSSIQIERLKRFIPFDYLSSACIKDLAHKIRIHAVEKGKILFKRGSTDPECHFLISGSIDLADEHFNIHNISDDSDENYLALDNSAKIHRASAITTKPCQFYSINRDYLDLVTTWSQLADDFENEHSEFDESDDTLDWMEALLNSPLFALIPAANIQKLLVRFQEHAVVIGEKIITEGEKGNTLYVIKEGRAVVTQGFGHKQKTVAAIQAGHCFGEDALIAESVRNATVTMASDGALMALGKDDFDELLKTPVIKRISLDELHLQMEEGESGTVLIDVRRPQEFRNDRLKGSDNVPLNHLRTELKLLNHDFHYVMCCDGGRRSEVAAYIMMEAGFQAVCLNR